MSVGLASAFLILAMIAFAFVGYPLMRASNRRHDGFVSVPVLFLIAAIVAAIAIYAFIGRPTSSLDHTKPATASSRMQAPGAAGQEKAGSVSSLISGLEDKVARNPEDAGNWLLLAKSYHHLGRPADARAAFDKARELGAVDAGLESMLNSVVSAQTSSGTLAIGGQVVLSAEALRIVEPTDTLFIIARDANGPPMPLAVVKTRAAEFPLTFSIGDADAMVAGRSLSNAKSIVIEAKISGTGDALSTKEGLSAKSEPFDPANAPQLSLLLTPDTAMQPSAEL
jgi:hypothetical protein